MESINAPDLEFNSGTSSISCNCFNCGFSAYWEENKPVSKTFKFFLKAIGVNDQFIKELDFEIFKQTHNIKIVREGDELLSPDQKNSHFLNAADLWKAVPLPDDSYPISFWLENDCNDINFLKVVDYAISRKLYDLDQFYWTPTEYYHLNNRLIIPYYHKGKIVGFTARYAEDINDNSTPKYYQQCPLDFVYNLDLQNDWKNKFVIVTEGVLDAWNVNGVAILGEINQPKIDIINRLQKIVIVCPDRDLKGGDLVEAALHNNWQVSYPNWSREIKDAAQASIKYGRLLTIHSILSSAIKNKEKIKLKLRIQNNERFK